MGLSIVPTVVETSEWVKGVSETMIHNILIASSARKIKRSIRTRRTIRKRRQGSSPSLARSLPQRSLPLRSRHHPLSSRAPHRRLHYPLLNPRISSNLNPLHHRLSSNRLVLVQPLVHSPYAFLLRASRRQTGFLLLFRKEKIAMFSLSLLWSLLERLLPMLGKFSIHC